MSNLLILPVLLTKKMKNTFNQLLICLTVFDNVFVMCSILECIRKYHISTPGQIVSMMRFFFLVQYFKDLIKIVYRYVLPGT